MESRRRNFRKGTTDETIESKTRPDKLHEGLANCAEVERQREAVAVCEAMAEVAEVRTQSVLTHEIGADGDDMTPAGRVAKSLRNRVGRDGSPQGGPKRIDSVETTTEDPMVKTVSRLVAK